MKIERENYFFCGVRGTRCETRLSESENLLDDFYGAIINKEVAKRDGCTRDLRASTCASMVYYICTSSIARERYTYEYRQLCVRKRVYIVI